MIELSRQPSPRELRWFGWIPTAFFALLGGLVLWRTGSCSAAAGLFLLGAALGALSLALPPIRRPLHRAWMRAFHPIAWGISHLLMGAIFYGIVTPIGLLLRALGRDPLARALEPEAKTHWLTRSSSQNTKRYFRQF